MFMPSLFGESMFDEFFGDFAFPTRRATKFYVPASNIMRTDVKESDGLYELDIDLPGFKKEDVKAELKNGYLTIQASTDSNEEEKDENGKYIRKERYSGSCSRSFFVGEDITQEDIKAKFENGILKILVPKKEEQPKVEQSSYIAIEG